jgi:alkyl hydroperoxide reductase subunit AhpC
MITAIRTAAPTLEADAFVRGAGRRHVSLEEYRGGAVVLAATPDDWHEIASSYSDEPVRFPILASVEETRRITLIVDPGGVVRHVGLRRSARETLAALESELVPAAIAA